MKKFFSQMVAGIMGLFLAAMSVYGFHASMRYDTFLLPGTFWEEMGELSLGGCLLLGAVLWALYSVALYFFYGAMQRKEKKEKAYSEPRFLWLISAGGIYLCYLVILLLCYPGFYNYDMGNQLPQIMYAETPFDAHHPLLHTIVGGGLISIGWHLKSDSLRFGIFLYNAVQMGICALSFGYAVRFVYRQTKRRIWPILSGLFYVTCPPVVMFAMSTTKDVSCYAALLAALLCLYTVYLKIHDDERVTGKEWLQTAIFFIFSALLRNNVGYALILTAIFAMLVCRKQWRKQLLFWAIVILAPFLINKGLMYSTNATPGSTTEALSVPFQQLARLYEDEGEEAFSEEELDLLYQCIDPVMLSTYDPVIADAIKYAFWLHIDFIKENKGELFNLWLRKGFEYPSTYIASFLDNTYQAWYPLTQLKDEDGIRYSDIPTLENTNVANPKCLALWNFFVSVREGAYRNWPIARLFCTTGVMFVIAFVTLGYAWWKKDLPMGVVYMTVAFVTLSCFAGPVSDVRYYLILFDLLPVSVGFLAAHKGLQEKNASGKLKGVQGIGKTEAGFGDETE